MKRRSELRFVFIRPIVRLEIVMVGRADVRHVIIVFAPCITAAAAGDVSCLPRFAFCGSSSAPLTKNIVADTQTPRYGRPLIREHELERDSSLLRTDSTVSHPRMRLAHANFGWNAPGQSRCAETLHRAPMAGKQFSWRKRGGARPR